jgi:hypothetical protein
MSGHGWTSKGRKMNVGFTGRGKTHRKRREVSGHDFSRAAKAAKMNVGFIP